MSPKVETPQETLERLNAEQRSRATARPVEDRPRKSRLSRTGNSRDRYPRIRLVLTVLMGLAAVVFGSSGLFHAVEMSRFGDVVAAEVLSVDIEGRGPNTVYVEYEVGGVVYRGHVDDWWSAPDAGDSTDIIYDTRDVTRITDAPLVIDYVMNTLAVGCGAGLLFSAGRDVYRRRTALRGSQWLPD